MENVNKLLNFIKLTNDFKKIERDIPQSSSFSKENDAEHSYQLAMVCWYIATTENSGLDIEKVLKYSLIHDLPEVYAGDTPLYTYDDNYLKTKKNREAESALRIRNEFPDFLEMHACIEKYESLEDEESRLVYAVDKVLPIFFIFSDKGHAWKTHRIDIETLIEKNKDRIAVSGIAERYFYSIIEEIKKDKELVKINPIIFEKALTYYGEKCDVHHIDVDDFTEIPDELKLKAHAVCVYDGKMVLVNLPKWDIWSIPGGTREFGELIEDTLRREVEEETNCKIVDFTPIAYQKIINSSGDKFHYRLHYLCKVTPMGEFKEDVARGVNKIAWINPSNFEAYIENKEFRKTIIRRAIAVLKNENRKD